MAAPDQLQAIETGTRPAFPDDKGEQGCPGSGSRLYSNWSLTGSETWTSARGTPATGNLLDTTKF